MLTKFRYKGSSRSGNYAHAGRPGKVGGSAPKGKTGAEWLQRLVGTDEFAQMITDRLAKLSPQFTADTLRDAYDYHDTETGLTAKVTFVGYQADKVMVMGAITDAKTGKKVGEFYRDVYPTHVEHDTFELDESYQKGGFGSRFYMNSEDAYRRAGVKAVMLTANIDVGGYAWARLGFDFAGSSRADMLEAARFTWKRAGHDPKLFPQNVQHAWELAAMVAPDGDRIGRTIMLGSFWRGFKSLEPGSPGIEVCGAYLKSKGIR